MAVVVWTAYAFQVEGCVDKHNFGTFQTREECEIHLAESKAKYPMSNHVFVCGDRILN